MQTDTLVHMQRSCATIQTVYRTTKDEIELIDKRLAELDAEDHELDTRKNREMDPQELAHIERQRTQNRELHSRLEAERGRKLEQLEEIENDYNINQCPVVVGPLD